MVAHSAGVGKVRASLGISWSLEPWSNSEAAGLFHILKIVGKGPV